MTLQNLTAEQMLSFPQEYIYLVGILVKKWKGQE